MKEITETSSKSCGFTYSFSSQQRWEVVAEFVNQHSNQTDITRQPKETLAKAKEMQNSDFHLSSLKTEANQKAYENLQKGQKRDVKVRFNDSPAFFDTLCNSEES